MRGGTEVHLTEQQLHRAVADYLNLCLHPTVWWTTFPAGGGGLMRGKILSGLGLTPGVPDILIIDGGRAHWIELKAAKGVVSNEQDACMTALRLARCPTAVVRSLVELETTLLGWGIAMTGRIT